MKKIFLLLVAASFAAFSCQKQDKTASCTDTAVSEGGAVTLNILSSDIGTKADPNANESTLSDIQVVLMRDEGSTKDEIYRYCTFTAEEIAAKKCTVKNLKVGKYNIYVVANGPDLKGVHYLSDLKDAVIELGEYNSPSSDFVMCGEVLDIEIKDKTLETCEVELSRFVSRVTLSKIKNNLPEGKGVMTVNYVVLSNVVSSQNLAGNLSVDAESWYNKDCRADEEVRVASHWIGTPTGVGTDIYKASCEELTFKQVSTPVGLGDSIVTPIYFYGYPNATLRRSKDFEGFESPYGAKATALDLSISFDGKTYYYCVPVIYEKSAGVFAGIDRNYNYDVQLVISGEGEDEPGKVTKKGSVAVTVTIKDWSDVSIPEVEI